MLQNHTRRPPSAKKLKKVKSVFWSFWAPHAPDRSHAWEFRRHRWTTLEPIGTRKSWSGHLRDHQGLLLRHFGLSLGGQMWLKCSK